MCVCACVCVSARACDSDGVEEDDEKKTIKFPFFSIILRLRTTFGLSGLFFFSVTNDVLTSLTPS